MNVGMVFAMIFTIILILFLIVFGSKQITDFFCLSSEAQTQKNIQDLERVVEQLYFQQGEGSSITYTLNLPQDAKFCFVNPDNANTKVYGGSESWKDWEPDRTYVSTIVENGYTLWYKHCKGQSGYKIANLFPSDPSGLTENKNFCARRNTELLLEHKGLWIEVSPSE